MAFWRSLASISMNTWEIIWCESHGGRSNGGTGGRQGIFFDTEPLLVVTVYTNCSRWRYHRGGFWWRHENKFSNDKVGKNNLEPYTHTYGYMLWKCSCRGWSVAPAYFLWVDRSPKLYLWLFNLNYGTNFQIGKFHYLWLAFHLGGRSPTFSVFICAC